MAEQLSSNIPRKIDVAAGSEVQDPRPIDDRRPPAAATKGEFQACQSGYHRHHRRARAEYRLVGIQMVAEDGLPPANVQTKSRPPTHNRPLVWHGILPPVDVSQARDDITAVLQLYRTAYRSHLAVES